MIIHRLTNISDNALAQPADKIKPDRAQNDHGQRGDDKQIKVAIDEFHALHRKTVGKAPANNRKGQRGASGQDEENKR